MKCHTEDCKRERIMGPECTPSAYCLECLIRRKTEREQNWRDYLKKKEKGYGWKAWSDYKNN